MPPAPVWVGERESPDRYVPGCTPVCHIRHFQLGVLQIRSERAENEPRKQRSEVPTPSVLAADGGDFCGDALGEQFAA